MKDLTKSKSNDPVNPDHYKIGVETIKVIEDKMGGKDSDYVRGYYLGNALKYLTRAKYKGKFLEDIKKADYYINRLIDCFEDPDAAEHPLPKSPERLDG